MTWWHIEVFGSRDDFFISSYLAFTVPSKKTKQNKTTTKTYNGMNGTSQKEKRQRQSRRKNLKDFQDDVCPTRRRLDYDFIYDFYHTCMTEGSDPSELHHNLTAIQRRNSAPSVQRKLRDVVDVLFFFPKTVKVMV